MSLGQASNIKKMLHRIVGTATEFALCHILLHILPFLIHVEADHKNCSLPFINFTLTTICRPIRGNVSSGWDIACADGKISHR